MRDRSLSPVRSEPLGTHQLRSAPFFFAPHARQPSPVGRDNSRPGDMPPRAQRGGTPHPGEGPSTAPAGLPATGAAAAAPSHAAPASPLIVATAVPEQPGAADDGTVDEAVTTALDDKGYSSAAEGGSDEEEELPLEDSSAIYSADPTPEQPAHAVPPVVAEDKHWAKKWIEKDTGAWSGEFVIAEAILHFHDYPMAKNIPWTVRAPEYKHTPVFDTSKPPEGAPEGGLAAYWSELKQHGHDHDFPTKEEIASPVWIMFHCLPVEFWRQMASDSDLYHSEVVSELNDKHIDENVEKVLRSWTTLYGGTNWTKLVNFFGVLTYRGATHTGQSNHVAAFSRQGYNEFYRMLGLQMMDYRATAGFWFESAASRAAASRAASTSPGAVPSPAKSAAPAKAPRQVKLGNSPDRINPLLEHIATDIATAREQYCFYCNVRSCFFQCKACTVPLHTPISSGGASNAWPCMARYHMPEFNKYNHAYSKAQGTEASWEVDPVVAAIRQADGKRRKKKDAGEEVTEFTTRKSPRL